MSNSLSKKRICSCSILFQALDPVSQIVEISVTYINLGDASQLLILFHLQLEEGNIKFDVCLSSESMYDSLKPLQQTLKSKMPHPRRGLLKSHMQALF